MTTTTHKPSPASEMQMGMSIAKLGVSMLLSGLYRISRRAFCRVYYALWGRFSYFQRLNVGLLYWCIVVVMACVGMYWMNRVLYFSGL